MKVKDTHPSMKSSVKRFGHYIEVIGNQPTGAPTNDLVKQLELQVNNQTNPTQPRKQNQPNSTKSLWTIPPNISMPTAAVPTSATSMTYKSVAQNANQRQTAVHTVQQQPQQRQQQAKPDPKAEDWAQKNSWFGQDQPMTYAAFGLHKQLIEDEGFDATSDEYYTELDNRIRTEFPHKFQETPKKSNSPRVASAGTTASKSSTPKGRRTVKLSASQIAIARRLNVPLEEYAKYVKE